MIHDAAFNEHWNIDPTASYILRRRFKRAALQFPDHLLSQSSDVAAALRNKLGVESGVQVFVLADSTYHSLGVDEVGAAHVNADCVVHYGYASLVPVSSTPAYFVFPKQELDIQRVAADLSLFASTCCINTSWMLVFPDQALEQHVTQLEATIQKQHTGSCRVVFARAASNQLDPPSSSKPSPLHNNSATGTTGSSSQRASNAATTACGTHCTTAGCTAAAHTAVGTTACGTPCTTAGCANPTANRNANNTADHDHDTIAKSTTDHNPDVAKSTTDQAADCAAGQLSQLQVGGCASCSCSNQQPSQLSTQTSGPESNREPPSSSTALHSTHPPSSMDPSNASTDDGNQAVTTDDGNQAATTDDGNQAVNGTCSTSSCVSSSTCCMRTAGALPVVATDACGTAGQSCESVSSDGGGERLLSWRIPAGVLTEPCSCVWVGGQESPLLLPLQLTLNHLPWSSYDPQSGSWEEGLQRQASTLLKKRYYLVEKARGANIVGLLVGTLGSATCLPALERVRTLAEGAGKKTYTILMGKPAPQKLANFPEIEVFVMLADPQGFILDSKEYYAPIITPYEALLAFTGQPWTGKYSLELESVLTADIDGDQVGEAAEGALTLSGAGALISQPNHGGKIVIKSAAEYLTKRSWQGLETPLTGAEKKAAELAEQGFTGRAATYTHEPSVS